MSDRVGDQCECGHDIRDHQPLCGWYGCACVKKKDWCSACLPEGVPCRPVHASTPTHYYRRLLIGRPDCATRHDIGGIWAPGGDPATHECEVEPGKWLPYCEFCATIGGLRYGWKVRPYQDEEATVE